MTIASRVTPGTPRSPLAAPGATPRTPVLRGVGPLVQPALVVLVGMLLLRTVLLFAGHGLVLGVARLVDPAATWDGTLVWSNVLIVGVDALTVLVVARQLRRAGSSLGALLRTATPGRDIAWGLAMFVITTVGFLVFSFVANLIAYQGAPPAATGSFQPPLWYGIWCLFLMPVTIAVAEEVLYRGYLQSVVTERWGRFAGIVVVSIFFGLQHLALTETDPRAWLARFLTTFLAGMLFGVLALWMKRLWPLIIGHWLLDAIFLGLFTFLASLGGQ